MKRGSAVLAALSIAATLSLSWTPSASAANGRVTFGDDVFVNPVGCYNTTSPEGYKRLGNETDRALLLSLERDCKDAHPVTFPAGVWGQVTAMSFYAPA